ncbi:MAG: aminoglycoside phosphotransferase family enzyme/predicted kinase [Gammaproteobacteria bacterium]|jgi:aminoglycoside phosphotransferase family enzyme/predicted kinase
MTDIAFLKELQTPNVYPHKCGDIRMVETHISWVLLTGVFAYKLKKPVNFGFLDFSTLEKRHYYCNEECRCNAVFAPEIYCGVVAVTIDANGRIEVGGNGEIVEYAVKMHQFDDANQLDHLLERDQLQGQSLRNFATDLASIYRRLPNPIIDSVAETADRILARTRENFDTLESLSCTESYSATLRRLEHWSVQLHQRLSGQFEERIRDGWIRERHGDLHLSNLVKTEQGVRAFDCIEFSADLRCIDAIDDIAFLVMDLAVRERADLAYDFIDSYLEATGDYSGACLLRYYAVYRSLVRAKVAALQLSQTFTLEGSARLAAHIEWANRVATSVTGRITLMCGPSGSGKSWLAERLVPHMSAIRLRSDIVRKQLAGLEISQASGSTLDGGIYTTERSDAVYTRLLELTEALTTRGENVIVDATFLSSQWRSRFRALAASNHSDCVVTVCEAAPDILERRVVARYNAGGDPSEATPDVLRRQLETLEPLGLDERMIRVCTSEDVDIRAVVAQLNSA